MSAGAVPNGDPAGGDALRPGDPLADAAAQLRATPDASPGAAARAVAAALAAQAATREGASPLAHTGGWRQWAWAAVAGRPAALAAGVALAVGVGAWMLGGRSDGTPGHVVAAGATPRGAGATTRERSAETLAAPVADRGTGGVPAALAEADEAPRLVRFRLRAPGAHRVSVVGDFNRWDVAATPLASQAGEWTADVPLTPGRHAYAFVVDGRRRVLDPAAPSERDPDFGGAHSVTVVGVAP